MLRVTFQQLGRHVVVYNFQLNLGILSAWRCFLAKGVHEIILAAIDLSGNQEQMPNTRMMLKKLKKCRSKAAQTRKESKLGCRYCSLVDLGYFRPKRFLIIDPMRNLFLVIGRRISIVEGAEPSWQLWIWVNSRICWECVPGDIGRIPSKIASGFSGFKEDQFKTWITIYFIPTLFGLLPDDHFECWRHFILTCLILCKQSFSYLDITLADSLLHQFCKRGERLYGKAVVAPNMHLHGHLKDAILDYGPIQEFWYYSFERFNGILGNQPGNSRGIEPQPLKQFLPDNDCTSYVFPDKFADDFFCLDLDNVQRSVIRWSVLDTITKDEILLPTKSKPCVFSSYDLDQLRKQYELLHPAHCRVNIDKFTRSTHQLP